MSVTRLVAEATCDPSAERVIAQLGNDCHDVSPVVSVRNPLDLAHWSMPLLEVLVIGGAVLALWHAVRRFREGDAVALAMWCAPLVYLFVTEPPLYFPEWFNLDDVYGFIFAHNLFTVQLMWDRLPLYIVAFYPAIAVLAYEVVRVLGVFRDRGAAIGAVLVAFVCQVFYEVFDHLGPQLGWWTWNDDNVQVSHPMLGSVPMTSMLLFASVSFGALTFAAVRLTGTPKDEPPRRGWSLAWRILVTGLLAFPTMAVAAIPSGFFGGETPNHTAQAWVMGVELGLVWVAGLWILATQVRRRGSVPPVPLTPFARVYPAAFLGVHAMLWLAALPSYLDATDGLTADGYPIGSGPYAAACFTGGLLVLAALATGRRRAEVVAG